MMMRGLLSVVFAVALLGAALPSALAEEPLSGDALIEDFTMQPEIRWRFFTDQVMGGISTGGVTFAKEDGVGSSGQRNIFGLRCSERTHDGTNRSPWLVT